jgi:hypothetical protein
MIVRSRELWGMCGFFNFSTMKGMLMRVFSATVDQYSIRTFGSVNFFEFEISFLHKKIESQNNIFFATKNE